MPVGRDQSEAIVAVGTPIGTGSRSLVRASGSGILSALSTVVTGPASALMRTRRRGISVARLDLPDDATTISMPIIVCTAPGPGSFTGEDVAEFEVPGHPVLAARVRDRLVEVLESAGVPARCAVAGEFSARAFLAGRLGVEEATAIAVSIEATRDDDLAAAERLRADGRGGGLAAVRTELIAIAARLEAGIDFTDEEDVVACTVEECRRAIAGTTKAIRRMRDASDSVGGDASDVPRVVLVGRPNAGKSTLFNLLCGEDRMVVSDTAGTTRDSIEAMVTIEDGHAPTPFLLVDTAGIGAATTDVLESHATAAATRAIDSGDVVVRCRPADDADDGGSFPSTVVAAVIDVITKCDLGPGLDPRTAPGTDDAPIRVSSVTGAGIEGLRRRISKAVADVTGSDIRRSLLDRLSRGLRAAESRLDEATVLLASAEADVAIPSPELVAASIRAAVDELGLLDGSLDPERVLDDVFGRFCIGK